MQQNKTFEEFVSQIGKMQGVQQVLSKYESQYNLKKYKITEICAQNVLSIYQHIVEKFYKNHDLGDSATWVENQLRLFLWTLLCYLFSYQKTISEMKQQDWDFFAQIFYVKEKNLSQYQARTLLDEEAKALRWSQQEDYMLYQLIMRDRDAKWNQIAKSLYINSGKRFLRASKQCRQRWLNHLDPNKSKIGWTMQQLLIVFEHVAVKGKKWAQLVKKLDEKRGEHTIKNKYNSIIKKQSKISAIKSEDELRKQVIFRLKNILENQKFGSNDEFILGLNSKLRPHAYIGHIPQYSASFGSFANKNDALQKKFDDFRKKIEKFSSENAKAQKLQSLEVSPINDQQQKTTATKVSHLIEKLQSPRIFKLPTAKKEDLFEANNQDNIFYDDSYEQLIPMQLNNQEMLAEEINNFIVESELDF